MAGRIATRNGVAPLLEPQRFQDFAYAELNACQIHTPGECYYPDCSKEFERRTEKQVYCSRSCKAADTAERRKWGHRMAEALLYWRAWKFTKDPAKAAVVRMARKYITQLQSEWFKDRAARRAAVIARRGLHG